MRNSSGVLPYMAVNIRIYNYKFACVCRVVLLFFLNVSYMNTYILKVYDQ